MSKKEKRSSLQTPSAMIRGALPTVSTAGGRGLEAESMSKPSACSLCRASKVKMLPSLSPLSTTALHPRSPPLVLVLVLVLHHPLYPLRCPPAGQKIPPPPTLQQEAAQRVQKGKEEGEEQQEDESPARDTTSGEAEEEQVEDEDEDEGNAQSGSSNPFSSSLPYRPRPPQITDTSSRLKDTSCRTSLPSFLPSSSCDPRPISLLPPAFPPLSTLPHLASEPVIPPLSTLAYLASEPAIPHLNQHQLQSQQQQQLPCLPPTTTTTTSTLTFTTTVTLTTTTITGSSSSSNNNTYNNNTSTDNNDNNNSNNNNYNNNSSTNPTSGTSSNSSFITPLVELVFQRADPKSLTEPYLAAFHLIHAQGQLQRDNVLRILRMWHGLSLLIGSDVTWGVAAVVGKTTGITMTEVEGDDSLRLDMSDAQRQAYAKEMILRTSMASHELQTSDLFKQYDDGYTPTIMMAMLGSLKIRAANDAFDRHTNSAISLNYDMVQRKTIPVLLFANFIAHDDRLAYMTHSIQSTFNGLDRIHTSQFVKIFDGDGDVRLHIMSIDSWSKRGKYSMVSVCRIEPAPPSRHLSARPDVRLIMHSFRRRRPFEESVKLRKNALASSSSSSCPSSASASASTTSSFPSSFSSFPSFLPVTRISSEISTSTASSSSSSSSFSSFSSTSSSSSSASTSLSCPPPPLDAPPSLLAKASSIFRQTFSQQKRMLEITMDEPPPLSSTSSSLRPSLPSSLPSRKQQNKKLSISSSSSSAASAVPPSRPPSLPLALPRPTGPREEENDAMEEGGREGGGEDEEEGDRRSFARALLSLKAAPVLKKKD